jgi:hypothetical protein
LHDVSELGRDRPPFDGLFRRSHAQRLGEDEGVAARELVQRFGELRVALDVHPVEELFDLARVELRQHDAVEEPAPVERGQCASEG